MTPEQQLAALDNWYAAMRRKMEHGLRVGRTGWADCSGKWLLQRLNEETQELLNNPSLDEAADVANFAFMLAERMLASGETADDVCR